VFPLPLHMLPRHHNICTSLGKFVAVNTSPRLQRKWARMTSKEKDRRWKRRTRRCGATN